LNLLRRHFKAFKFFSASPGPFERPFLALIDCRATRNCTVLYTVGTRSPVSSMGAMDTKPPSFDVMALLTQHNTRWALSKYQENQIVYSQGDAADSVFYIHRGKVKATVVSKRGKEAIVAIRGPDEFCGEGALTETPLRLATTTTLSTCKIIRLEKKTVVDLLHKDPELLTIFSPIF
jgi:Cyclic nucleotide-binding domain